MGELNAGTELMCSLWSQGETYHDRRRCKACVRQAICLGYTRTGL